MNIENFKNSFSNVARPTLFEVSGFGLPADLRVRVKATSLPTETVGIIEVPYMGRVIKEPGDRAYEEWTFTVMQTNDFNVHRAVRAWMAGLNGPVSNVGQVDKRDGVIDHLDNNNSIVETILIKDAWPTIIGPVELDWENQNSIETFDVTLAYDYHE